MPDALPLWPLSRVADAVAALAHATGWSLPPDVTPPVPPDGFDADPTSTTPAQLGDYVDVVATAYGIDAEFVSVHLRDIRAFVEGGGPMLVWLRLPTPGVLPVLRAAGGSAIVLGPDGAPRNVDLDRIAAALAEPAVQQVRPLAERLQQVAGIQSAARRDVLLQSIVDRQFAEAIPAGFVLRLAQGRPLTQLAAGVSLPRLLRWFVGTHVMQFLLALLLTGMAGQGALAGRVDIGWLTAGGLILLSLLPLQLLESWTLGRIAVASGVVVRQRLLSGALRLPLEQARKHGYGDFIGQMLESEGVEIGLRAGGLTALGALLDLGVALWVMAVATPRGAAALLVWLGLAAVAAVRYARVRQHWTDVRFGLTRELLEKMLGHRTRLVQERPSTWHRREDSALQRYQESSRALDGWTLLLGSAVPFGWLILAVLTMAPLWLQAQASETRLALAIWGTLLGWRAFTRLSSGCMQLVGAAIAWQRCRHLLHSAGAPEPPPLTATTPTFEPATVALEANNITVRHSDGAPPILRGLTLRLHSGQRLLLQGASGSGKSTLAAALTGLAPIDSGQLLLGGLDMAALGTGRWRRLVVSAPQFHENHLFADTLAFNLLLGRAWPPSVEDLQEAAAICDELGLGPLLSRMPSGLFQNVGEGGWQLSHGERSRVFVARTLLQRSQVVLLDESFAALDPPSLARALDCVLRRAPTLVVIAHP